MGQDANGVVVRIRDGQEETTVPLDEFRAECAKRIEDGHNALEELRQLNLVVPTGHHLKVSTIQVMVANYYEMPLEKLVTKQDRRRSVARPRQMAMYLARKLTDLSFPEIAQEFNRRDHTTVMYAVRTIEGLRRTDDRIDSDCSKLVDALTKAEHLIGEGPVRD